MLKVNKQLRKSPKGSKGSSSPRKISGSQRKGKSPQKTIPFTHSFPNKQCDVSTYSAVVEGKLVNGR